MARSHEEPFSQDCTIRRLMSSAGNVKQLDEREGSCQAWKVDIDAATSCVVKKWPPQRVAQAAQQIASEVQAGVLFEIELGMHIPVMALPIYSCVDRGCSFMVTPYAGPCVLQLRHGPWAQLGLQQLVCKCRRLAACGLTTLSFLEAVSRTYGGRKLHRDIKPDNYCYDAISDLFVLLDFGGLCSANKQDWFNMQDMRCIDPHLAALDGNGIPALFSIEGHRSNTHRTMDLYMLALTVVYVYLGKLPDPINVLLYDEQEVAKYLAAVRKFSWGECKELKGMPADMREWLLLLLEKEPSMRPQSSFEARTHSWVAAERSLVEDAIAVAISDWEDVHVALSEAMGTTVAQLETPAAQVPALPDHNSFDDNLNCCSAVDLVAFGSSPSTASNPDVAVLPSSSSRGSALLVPSSDGHHVELLPDRVICAAAVSSNAAGSHILPAVVGPHQPDICIKTGVLDQQVYNGSSGTSNGGSSAE